MGQYGSGFDGYHLIINLNSIPMKLKRCTQQVMSSTAFVVKNIIAVKSSVSFFSHGIKPLFFFCAAQLLTARR